MRFRDFLNRCFSAGFIGQATVPNGINSSTRKSGSVDSNCEREAFHKLNAGRVRGGHEKIRIPKHLVPPKPWWML